MKSGYIYVLVHPSDPDLYKIGMTTRHPEKRLVEHNSNYDEYTGRIVKETGQKWEIKTYMAVENVVQAEAAFWGATPLADIPYRGGVEVAKMEWGWIETGLNAAKNVGVRRFSKVSTIPDWVYSYTRWMKKRLKGRDIILVGTVKSMISGKANFRCSNGHEWRTRCLAVAEGAGCPQCGTGTRMPEEVWQAAKLGHVCLLTNPDQPGFIKIGVTYKTLEQFHEEIEWEGWDIHRRRFVEEPVLAEELIWELLDCPIPQNLEPVKIELSRAEQAFRDLIYRMHKKVALMERV